MKKLLQAFPISKLIMLFFVLLFTGKLMAQPFLKAHPHINPYQYEVVKEKSFDNGAVTSAHSLASMVGAAMMQEGGNAFDAAIATQLSLAVVFPGAGNIGGGGFMLARKVNGELIGIDYREAAPASASRDMYLDAQGNPIDGKSTRGASASGIPGSIAGMISTHAYAKLPFAKLIQPAIEFAEFGYVISEREAKGLNADREEMQHSGGYISLEDLKNYKPKFRKPVEFDYRDHHIISFAPPSSGGILIAQMMQMIAPFNVEKMGLNTLASVNLMVESQRRAYADRAEHMGDPDYWKVPTKTLISNSYAQARMSDYKEGVAGSSKVTLAGGANESEQTTHLSVIDKEGNMVAITTTLNDTYGNKTIVAGAGFLLNNEMDDFSVKPGVPNMYGALGGEANSIQPGKRMLSSMTPTLVTVKGKPYISIGTPGGTTIPNQVYEGLVNIIDHKMTIKQAIDATRFHHQWIPDVIALENDFPEDIETSLKNLGYKTIRRGKFGRMDGILISSDGKRMAAGDKRGDDSVAGY